jgi:hypothetical protein
VDSELVKKNAKTLGKIMMEQSEVTIPDKDL